jgi:predicted GIY-YIG superfamily endonuclease
MKTQGTFTLRKLYAFEHPDKSVYIGLTYNYERRYKAHMETSKILIAKHKVMGHRFVTFDTLYPAHEAALKEQELIENYRRAGWKILNKNKAGALGGNIKKWDFEKIQKLAKKYKTVKQFYTRQPSAAVIARRNGWMDKVCRHMISKAKRRYTDQELIKLAEQSGSRGKMRKLFNGAYQVALRRGVLDTVFPLSLKKQK